HLHRGPGHRRHRGVRLRRAARCGDRRRHRPARLPGPGGPARRAVTEDAGGQPGESEKERVDRELIELLNELRVALPGVQVLFAFLLVVPFQQRFAAVTDFQKTLYFVSLLLAAGACALLVAPSAYHRILL